MVRSIRGCVVNGVGMAALLFPSHPAVAQGSQLIRGRVVDREHRPLVGVEIRITGQSTGAVQLPTTDAKGVYTAVFRDPEDGYLLTFRKVGFAAFTTTAQGGGLGGIVDVPETVLSGSFATLQPIVATTTLRVPAKGEVPSVGAVELNTMNAGSYVNDPTSLAALFGTLAGVRSIGDSAFSVLGAPSSQNSTRVDGALFDGGALPRDAVASARVVTNTFDPSKGQFSGGQAIISLRPGADQFTAKIRGEAIDPHLAWADPASPVAVPHLQRMSGFVTGAFVPHRGQYLLSFDLQHQATPLTTLLNVKPSILTPLGVSPDTVAAVRYALASIGVPVNGADGLDDRSSRRGLATFRGDYKPSALTSYSLSAIGNWTSYDALSIPEFGFPSNATESTRNSIWLLARGGTYIHRILEDALVSFATTSAHNSPYIALPNGTVQVGTQLADGRSGLAEFQFGGSGNGPENSTTTTLDIANAASWATPNTHHQLKATVEFTVRDGLRIQQPNALGAFAYRSLTDLLANVPDAFSRTITPTALHSRAISASLSLGDIWRLVPGKFELQGGLRWDAQKFGKLPPYNPAIDSLFAIRSDLVPVEAGISPRLGFSWTPGGRRSIALPPQMVLVSPGQAGSYFAIARMMPADASGIAVLPPGSGFRITGGVGAYRGTIPQDFISELAEEAGASTGVRSVTCVGDAAPHFDWLNGAGAVPACSGVGPSAGSQAEITGLAPDFRAPVSWRGNLQANGLRVAGWGVVSQVTYSMGTHAQGYVDLNLRRTPVFTLVSERDRPVFADPAMIVPSSGLFTPAASRINPTYDQVREITSELRSNYFQATLSIVPPGTLPLYGIYVLSIENAQQNGFGGTTEGNPFSAVWAPGSQTGHQVIIGTNNLRVWWFTLGTRLTLYSGTSFTPVVSQDINGDRLVNDRAYIPDSRGSADTAVARQLETFLMTAPGNIRKCLESQAGAIARINSCRTSWAGQVDLNLAFTPPQDLMLGNRLKITMKILNAGSGLVHLLGLGNSPFGQAPQSSPVDPRLLFVTGFDSAAHRFTYAVNQLFGSPLDGGAARHNSLPFELQLGLEYRIGYPPTAQAAKDLGLLGGASDSVVVAASVRDLLMQRSFGANPIARILRYRDSLGLTAAQLAGIQMVAKESESLADSILRPIVAYAIHEKKKLTNEQLFARIEPVARAVQGMIAAERAKAEAYLLPEQRIRLGALPP